LRREVGDPQEAKIAIGQSREITTGYAMRHESLARAAKYR
jgi:hypothetical protein